MRSVESSRGGSYRDCREDLVVIMQDHPHCSQETDRESSFSFNGTADRTATGESSPTRCLPYGEAATSHEFDRLRQRLDLAYQEVKILREQKRVLERTIKELALLTCVDHRTGLGNRRRFRKELKAAWSYAIRHNLLLSTIVLDLDQFKTFKETLGASAGNQVLHTTASLLASGLRTYDFIALLGDGVFAVGLPSTDRSEARQIAERLRRAMDEHDWPLQPITARFGVATLESSAIRPRQLVHQSFQALRHAKHKGRNQVEHFVDLPVLLPPD